MLNISHIGRTGHIPLQYNPVEYTIKNFRKKITKLLPVSKNSSTFAPSKPEKAKTT